MTMTPDLELSPSIPGEGTARMPDGTILRTLVWRTDAAPWAQALVVHGLGEHGGLYGPVARPLTAAGIEVHAYDARGFGGSAGRRAYVDRWSQYHDDLEARIGSLRDAEPELPLILYGHSLGGLVALGYVLGDVSRALPDLLVLSAPGIDSTVPAWRRRLAGLLTNVVPRMRLANNLAEDGLSRDPEVRARSNADPLCQSKSSVRLGAEAFAEQARVKAELRRLTSMPIPAYVLHGSDDPIVPVGATEILEGVGGVTRRVHEGLRHECHHEPEHEDVLAEVVAWIRANAPTGVWSGSVEPADVGNGGVRCAGVEPAGDAAAAV